ncbi:MAG TPA: cyclic-di-AMP receptor [Oscillospiraceae bacterium]|nr:cyclic-di-AMP receptor [Oscillospiraceae bacterium]
MKLIIAIVHDDDVHNLIDDLTKEDFRVTKLATTGGFLKAGNTTLFIGVEDDKANRAIEVIKDNCETRRQTVASPTPMAGTAGVFIPYPIEVQIGGATVFVIDIEKYLKL